MDAIDIEGGNNQTRPVIDSSTSIDARMVQWIRNIIGGLSSGLRDSGNTALPVSFDYLHSLGSNATV